MLKYLLGAAAWETINLIFKKLEIWKMLQGKVTETKDP